MAARIFFGHFKNVQFQKVAKEFLQRGYQKSISHDNAVKP
jgi:hypothetical protein